MKKILKKRNMVLAIVAVLAVALFWYLLGNSSEQMKTAGQSPYRTAPLEQYIARTEQGDYNKSVTEIKVSVCNNGKTMHEFLHPILESQQNGKWYSLKKEPENTTADLLGVEPGGTKTFRLWTKNYGKLDIGHYRVVFPTWGSMDYIAAEFNIT